MPAFFRPAIALLLIVAASNASAGVIKQDGVVFTSSFTGKVLTLEIDAAGRSGGWAGATAIDALALKGMGSFTGVSMASSTGAGWSLLPAELKASGCGAAKAGASTGLTRLCYTGPAVALTDNMLFTFTFTGTPALEAPHLKVHFVDARGDKVGSLLSLDFPAQAASVQGGGAAIATELSATPLPAPASTSLSFSNAGFAAQVDLDDLDDAAAVPEPGALALSALGMFLLAMVRRRRAGR